MDGSEIWKTVADWEGFYEVSDHGRVRSMTRVLRLRNAHGSINDRTFTGKLLAAHVSSNGYAIVSLTRPGQKPSCQNVHTLVLLAFCGPPLPGQECCHGPAGPTVNTLANLRWGSRSSNSLDRHRDGTVSDYTGEKGPAAKLTKAQVGWVREAAGTVSHREIARQLAVSHATIGAIIRHTTWKEPKNAW